MLEAGVQFHLYADDTQLYTPVNKDSVCSVKDHIETTVEEISEWMSENKLKLNGDKTELISFRKPSTDLLLVNLSVSNSTIVATPTVRNLGFYFDEFLTLTFQISLLCKTCNFILSRIGRVRHLLDIESTKLLIHSLVTSRIDYCNSLYVGLPKKSLTRIQTIQNRAARIVTRSKLRDHITPVLQSLHWLPIESRIHFKIACITFKTIHNCDPHYLHDLLKRYEPPRALRSSGQCLLVQQKPKSLFTGRAFCYAAPEIWNSLSQETRSADTFACFKVRLKTELFKKAFFI